MRAVVQRVSRARVKVGGEEVGAIGPGLLVLVGVHKSDSAVEAKWLAGKIANLRIFADEAGKMSLDVRELERSVLVVSQFTLHADCEKGRRPSFVDAAPPPSRNRSMNGWCSNSRRLAFRCRRVDSAPTWKSNWSTTDRSPW